MLEQNASITSKFVPHSMHRSHTAAWNKKTLAHRHPNTLHLISVVNLKCFIEFLDTPPQMFTDNKVGK